MIDVRTVVRRGLLASDRAKPLVTATARAGSTADVLRSGVFDRGWYEAQLGRRLPSAAAAAAHYVGRGRFAGLSPSPLFEPEWYLPGRWRKADRDPLATYLEHGTRAGASPHPLFDPAEWSLLHPGAQEHRAGPLGHFLATADERTPLPLPPDLAERRAAAGRPPLLYGDLLRRLADGVRGRREREAVRTAPRVSAGHDADADAAYVRRMATVDLPRGEAPLVSVVMPVYNRATTLVAAVASLQRQTLDDWELVVVDDGSTDLTAAVLGELAGRDPRIRVLEGEHRGISVARNVAAAAARGQYLAFLDSDNTWTPDFLRTAVAGLRTAGGRVGYATSELRTSTGSGYRDLDAQVDHFAVRNHVDLNVLVLERALFEDVGGFDERLRRTVDYDLVWSVGRSERLHHLPFVGVVYDDDAEGADRVTVNELYSWKDVVRAKHLVDWEAARARERRPGSTTVLLVARNEWGPAVRAARSALADGAPGNVETVVVEWSSRPSVGRVLDVLALAEPGLVVEHAPDDVRTALGVDLGLARAAGERVLLLADDAVLPAGAIARLGRRLDEEGVVAVQPLVLDRRDVVRSAGWAFPARGVLPSPFLADFPREDARRAGEVVDVPALDGGAMLVRAADLVAVGGADPLYVDLLWDADLSLRLTGATGGRCVVDTGLEVVRSGAEPRHSPGVMTSSRRAFVDRWSGREPQDGRPLWQRAGLEVAHYAPVRVKGVPLHLRVPAPVVTRAPRAVERVDERPPRLRWSVRTATPPGEDGLHWGDLHFAEALAAALTDLGQVVSLDGRASLWRSSTALDEVTLSIRGKIPLPPQPGAVNVLWVISHPQRLTKLDLAGVDAAFAASITWARWATTWSGTPVRPLLQATDPDRFNTSVEPLGEAYPRLLVGNSRGVYRPVVRHLLEAGEEVAVYGGGWEGMVPPAVIKAQRVDNVDLPGRYRAARVVLNDHWEDMRRLGFISNRLFDAAACGARVLSDEVEGVDEIFGGLVRTWRGPGELVELARAGEDAFPGTATREQVAARVGREHSFAARAAVLLDAAVEAHRRREG